MNLTDSDKRKLRDAFAVRASVNGNLMNFIGLDEVRERFPSMWERNRDRLLATTQAILKQFTDPLTDVVLPISDGNFVVLFTQLDKHEAMLRAAAIKAAVLRRFMGDEALDTLDMQVQAMEMDSGTLMDGTLGELLSAPPSVPVTPPRQPERARPPERDSGEEAQKVYRASLADLLSHADLPLDEMAKRFEFSFDDLEFGFQPFFYADKGVFSVFACRPVRYGVTGNILTGYEVLPDEPDVDQISTLDTMILMRARHGLVDMALRKRVAVVVVPVSFETMTNRASATSYLATLQKIPSDLRAYLVPILCRCPTGVPEGRLAEIIHPLKRLGRAVSVRVESAKQPLAAIKSAGAFSVGINLAHAAGTPMASPDYVRRFVTTARKLGLHSFVDAIDTPELATRHSKAKADYLGGRQFAELTDYVGPISQMRTA